MQLKRTHPVLWMLFPTHAVVTIMAVLEICLAASGIVPVFHHMENALGVKLGRVSVISRFA